MSKLLIMRHAETIFGQQKKFSGIMDVPLSDQGIKQTISSAKSFPNIQFDIVYTSTLIRSLETALIFLAHRNLPKIPLRITEDNIEQYIAKYLPVIERHELRERGYGAFEGLTRQDIESLYSFDKDIMFKMRRSLKQAPPNGESLNEVLEKTKKFLDNNLMPNLKKGYDILIVAHQSSVRALYYLLFETSETEIEMIEFEHNEILHIDYKNDKFTLVGTNEDSFDGSIEED